MNASTLRLAELLVKRGSLGKTLDLTAEEIDALPPAINEALANAGMAENRLLELLGAVAAEQSTVKP